MGKTQIEACTRTGGIWIDIHLTVLLADSLSLFLSYLFWYFSLALFDATFDFTTQIKYIYEGKRNWRSGDKVNIIRELLLAHSLP